MPSRHAVPISLSGVDRATLEGWTRRRKAAQALARRARIAPACAEPGATSGGVAQARGVSRPTVALRRRRFAERGPDGLLDEPRPGAPRRITDAQAERATTATLEAAPPSATHGSSRSLAAAAGLSQSAVVRIWRAFALQPRRVETFELSRGPLFIDKARDIVGLHISPPERALVLCVDEKPSIQAIERTAPVLPMRPGQVERRTHDHARHGTSDLLAALDAEAGKVIGACHRRHRAQESRAFLDAIDRGLPPGLDVHLVLDDLRTRKTPPIQRWLAKRPRDQLRFTPPSASWLDLVEAWFALLTRRRLRRGVFRSTHALERAIRRHIEATSADPRPCVWTTTADQILDSVKRSRQRTTNGSKVTADF